MKRKNTTIFFSNNIEVYTVNHSCTKQGIVIQTYIFFKKEIPNQQWEFLFIT